MDSTFGSMDKRGIASEDFSSFSFSDEEHENWNAHFAPSVIVANQQGLICSINESACLLFGYRRDELLGKSINTLMPKAVAEQHDRILQRYFERGNFKGGTTRVVFGVTKWGLPVKLKLSFSNIDTGSSHYISALIETVEERSFSLVTDSSGVVALVEGNVQETCGYRKEELVGRHVSLLLPSQQRVDDPMLTSSVINVGQRRNKDMRHALGHIFPVSMEVQNCEGHLYRSTFTEVDQNVEAMITVDQFKTIVSVSPDCCALFGYDESEMIGMPVATLAPGILLREGSRTVNCQHKDGSFLFVRVDIEPYWLDGEECYRGMIKRVKLNKVSKQRSQIQYPDTISCGDVLDWYEVTKKVLGEGFFGSVKVGYHRLSGVPVAIKTLKKQQFLDNGMRYPPREVEIMSSLKHPNIFRFFHAISTDTAVYLISELVSGGELFDYASQREHLPESECRVIVRQILSAVAYMHSKGICHRDLKLENILIDAFGVIKIIDFGLGNFFTSGAKLSTFCGSPDYAPPELWRSQPYYGPAVDVWAVGVILYILVTGYVPFSQSSHVLEIHYFWPKEAVISENLRHFISGILQPESSRATVEQLCNHSWITDDGKLVPVSLLKSQNSENLNEEILLHMEEKLGLSVSDVKKAVLKGEHNQLATTYALLEYQFEERLRNRRASDTPGSERRGSLPPSVSSSPRDLSESPPRSSGGSSPLPNVNGPRKGSLRDSLRDSSKALNKCLIM